MVGKVAVLEELRLAVVNLDEDSIEAVAKKAVEAGVNPLNAIEDGLAKGLREVGDKFERLEVFLSDMMIAASIMKRGVEILKGNLPKEGWKEIKGTIVIGTVQGDIHDIGKNLVTVMLMANGFEVHDLGIDVPPEQFIEKAQQFNAHIIGLSALLSTTMNAQAEVIKMLKELKLRDKYKVIVGGAPITKEWADHIGADSFGKDATETVKKVNELLGLEKRFV